MNRYFTLSAEQQILLLRQSSAKVGLLEQAIEKDLWVTVILQVLFSLPYAGYLVKDDTEYVFDNQVPLWMFGFLY